MRTIVTSKASVQWALRDPLWYKNRLSFQNLCLLFVFGNSVELPSAGTCGGCQWQKTQLPCELLVLEQEDLGLQKGFLALAQPLRQVEDL